MPFIVVVELVDFEIRVKAQRRALSANQIHLTALSPFGLQQIGTYHLLPNLLATFSSSHPS